VTRGQKIAVGIGLASLLAAVVYYFFGRAGATLPGGLPAAVPGGPTPILEPRTAIGAPAGGTQTKGASPGTYSASELAALGGSGGGKS
jgi:hypothetical protein